MFFMNKLDLARISSQESVKKVRTGVSAIVLASVALFGCNQQSKNFNPHLKSEFSVTDCKSNPAAWANQTIGFGRHNFTLFQGRVLKLTNSARFVGLADHYEADGHEPVLADGVKIEGVEDDAVMITPLHGNKHTYHAADLASQTELPLQDGHSLWMQASMPEQPEHFPQYPVLRLQVNCNATPDANSLIEQSFTR